MTSLSLSVLYGQLELYVRSMLHTDLHVLRPRLPRLPGLRHELVARGYSLIILAIGRACEVCHQEGVVLLLHRTKLLIGLLYFGGGLVHRQATSNTATLLATVTSHD